jgi:hypothetical protein
MPCAYPIRLIVQSATKIVVSLSVCVNEVDTRERWWFGLESLDGFYSEKNSHLVQQQCLTQWLGTGWDSFLLNKIFHLLHSIPPLS